ncbi:MAG: penicillin-binding protein 1C [Flavobacteriaceae bacterium]
MLSRPLTAAIGFACFAAAAAPVALRNGLAGVDTPPPSIESGTLVVGREGAILRAFPVADGRWRLKADLDQIDARFVKMLVAYEDRRFFVHDGVDGWAVLRAGGQALAHGRIVSGASTLTMQLARLQGGIDTKGAAGKLRQIALARAIESRAGKREILARYLTMAPYGGNIEGVRAASLAWFGKEPLRLSAAEAALLVALPQSPEARRPDRDPAAAKAARARVLERAVESGLVSPAEARVANAEPIPERHDLPAHAALLAARLAAGRPDGTVVSTTIDTALQMRLESLAKEAVVRLGRDITTAILVADIATGEIRASIGTADPFDRRRDGFIDMTTRPRSPGSALKPLIYALGFDAGLAHPETLIEDRPVSFAGYRPENFDHQFRGTVRVREALQLSLNVPAVKMLEAVGPARLVAAMRRAGAAPALSDISPPGLAVGLGGVGITLRDLVAIHAGLAGGGRRVDLHEQAAAVYSPSEEIVSRRAAWQVMDVLAGAPTPGNVRGGRIAFKTGTSYGYRDAWAVGADGGHVIGVWVGRPDGAPMPGLIGLDAAAPILFDAFERLSERVPLPGAPAGLREFTTTSLPPALRRFGGPRVRAQSAEGPVIAYPPAGARVEIGDGFDRLALKVRGGQAPFVWLADGVPIAGADAGRQHLYAPRGGGFVTLTVVDAAGASARASVFIDRRP